MKAFLFSLSLFIFAASSQAEAACPKITLALDETRSIHLPAQQANCKADEIFTCSDEGLLRVSGTVKSITNGSVQMTVYCRGIKATKKNTPKGGDSDFSQYDPPDESDEDYYSSPGN
jgi:hypothetical protein